jgi:hypothetical protein
MPASLLFSAVAVLVFYFLADRSALTDNRQNLETVSGSGAMLTGDSLLFQTVRRVRATQVLDRSSAHRTLTLQQPDSEHVPKVVPG